MKFEVVFDEKNLGFVVHIPFFHLTSGIVEATLQCRFQPYGDGVIN